MNFNIKLPKLVQGESASAVLKMIEQMIDIPQALQDQYQAYFQPLQQQYTKHLQKMDLQLFGQCGINLDAFDMMGTVDNSKPLTLIDCAELDDIDGKSYMFLYSPYLEQRFLEAIDEPVLMVVLDHLQATSSQSSEWLSMEEIEERWDWGYDVEQDVFDQWKAQREKAKLLINTDLIKTDTTSNIEEKKDLFDPLDNSKIGRMKTHQLTNLYYFVS